MSNTAKVVIAVPNMGSLHTSLAELLIRWHTIPTPGVGEIALFAPQRLQPHDTARNWCVKKFLEETDATHIFFVDSDVIPPKDALEKLLAADVDVISGAYPIKKMNQNESRIETVYALFSFKDGDDNLYPIKSGSGIAEIDRAGAGCLLIRRNVFDEISKPYFKWQYDAEGLMERGEDMEFCKKVKEAGIPIHAHFDVVCQHSKEILL